MHDKIGCAVQYFVAMKKALAIHDLSCHASSSLNVVMPIASAAGVDLSVLPSAILSTQSDGFEHPFIRDLDRECLEILDRWKALGLRFDSLYTGYLSHSGQKDLVMRVREEFLESDALVLTDPVFGDNGELYQNLEKEHIEMMLSLSKGSSVITPNWTEANLMVHRTVAGQSDEKSASDLAFALHEETGASVVITSVPLSGGFSVNLACDGSSARLFQFEHLDVSYPGSGDMFASLLLSFLLSGDSFFVASRKATEITSSSIRLTARMKREEREGVCVTFALRQIIQSGTM